MAEEMAGLGEMGGPTTINDERTTGMTLLQKPKR